MQENLTIPAAPDWVPADVVTLAVPAFIVLVILEMIAVRISIAAPTMSPTAHRA